MIIDSHTHIDEESVFLSFMEKTRKEVDLAFVLHWFKDDLARVAEFVNSKPNLRLIAAVEVNGQDHMRRQLESIDKLFKEKKNFGIKLYPGYQHFYVSEERIHPVAELCMKYDKPLVIHSGDVFDTDGEALLKYSHPSFIDELAMKFPKLKIVISHFGFPHLLECANIVSKNDNVYTDISGTLCEGMNPDEIAVMFDEYKKDLRRVFNYFPDIKDKVLFGTDYDWHNASFDDFVWYKNLVKELFTKEEQEIVFSKLAQKLFL